MPGQEPFPGFPAANDRLLYATHAGAFPAPWNATNNGPDPYLASRTDSGWVTDYKGLPADLTPLPAPSPPNSGEADSTLDTFAFAGPNLCSPCFDSGLETGLPVRLPNGELVQGMAGSLTRERLRQAGRQGRQALLGRRPPPDLRLEIRVRAGRQQRRRQPHGLRPRPHRRHHPDRLHDPRAARVLTGAGISQLDLSADGSRVIVGTKVGADSQGNEYVHPYMHVGSATEKRRPGPGTRPPASSMAG